MWRPFRARTFDSSAPWASAKALAQGYLDFAAVAAIARLRRLIDDAPANTTIERILSDIPFLAFLAFIPLNV